MSKQQETVYDISEFKEFDIKEKSKDRKNFSMVVCGARRSGKSELLRYMLKDIKDYYRDAYVFCETIKLQPQLFDYIPKENQFESFDETMMEKLWIEQENYIKRELSKDPEADKSKMDYKLIIFDDCISNVRFRQSPILNRFFVQGRHINLAVVILTQSISGKYGVNLVAMQNLDFFISFYLKGIYCREVAIGKYLSLDSIKEGNKVFKEMTKEKYRAIAIDNCEMSQEYKDFCYTIKASIKRDKFKIGKEPKKGDSILHLGFQRQNKTHSLRNRGSLSEINYNIILN